jgi:hypothetical protein
MYSYDQPNKNLDTVFISLPRIFVAEYDSGSPLTYNGQNILGVSTPPTGWTDVGVVESVTISVDKTIVHAEMGLPKSKRKSVEIKRETRIECVLRELITESMSLLMGLDSHNIMRTLTGEGVVQAGATRLSVTLDTGKGAGYVAGDRVCTAATTGGLIHSINRAIVESVATDTLTLAGTGFPFAPTSTHKLQKYYSVEMTDPVVPTSIKERTVLLFFDWMEHNNQRQMAVWFPRMSTGKSFTPDLKGGENFADASCMLDSLTTTQTLIDGTVTSVHGIWYFFD